MGRAAAMTNGVEKRTMGTDTRANQKDSKPPEPRERRVCGCCKQAVAFVWSCRCGFTICQPCMQENLWGMTCNYVNWTCPDCGASQGFGNQ